MDIHRPSHHHPAVVLVRYVLWTSSIRSTAAPRQILAQPAANDVNSSRPTVEMPVLAGELCPVPGVDSALAQSCVRIGRWSIRRRYRKLSRSVSAEV